MTSKKIVSALVAVAFIAGIMIAAMPSQSAEAGIEPTPFKAVINKLTSLNKFFGPPPEGATPPDDQIPEMREQLSQIKTEIDILQQTHDAWDAALPRR